MIVNNKKMNAYFEVLDVSKNSIIPPPSLPKPPEGLDKLNYEKLFVIADLTPPILVCADPKKLSYSLVSRHWCYQEQLSRGIDQILFYIFKNQSDYDIFKEKHETQINTCIESLIAAYAKTISSGTFYRHKAIKSKRQCIFCDDALMSPVHKIMPDKNNLIRVHCFNSKQNRCGFFLLVSVPEYYSEFKEYKFVTADRLKPVPERKCPKCKSPLYLRTMLMENGSTNYYECCENKFNSKSTCSYAIKLEEAPHWLSTQQ